MFLGGNEHERSCEIAEHIAASHHVREMKDAYLQKCNGSEGLMYAPFCALVNTIGDEIKSDVDSPIRILRSEHHHMVGPISKFYTKPDLVWLANPSFFLKEELIETLNNEHEKGQSTLIDLFLEEKWTEICSRLHGLYNSSSLRQSLSGREMDRNM